MWVQCATTQYIILSAVYYCLKLQWVYVLTILQNIRYFLSNWKMLLFEYFTRKLSVWIEIFIYSGNFMASGGFSKLLLGINHFFSFKIEKKTLNTKGNT